MPRLKMTSDFKGDELSQHMIELVQKADPTLIENIKTIEREMQFMRSKGVDLTLTLHVEPKWSLNSKSV